MAKGVAMLVVMLPINSIVARKLSTMHRSTMDLKDERLKMLTEVINGVKVCRYFHSMLICTIGMVVYHC